jgi:hypothetical protein
MKTLKKAKNKNNSLRKKEVNRILNANRESCSCDEMSEAYIPFIKSFVSHLVKEADELPEEEIPNDAAKTPEDFTPDQNQQDFENSLDSETDPSSFDTQGTDPTVAANAISAVKDWAVKLDEFAAFMNNPDSQSLHQLLASEDRPGSLLRGITRKASDSITRIAGEVAKLKETLNGFINMAPKKQRDTEILKSS